MLFVNNSCLFWKASVRYCCELCLAKIIIFNNRAHNSCDHSMGARHSDAFKNDNIQLENWIEIVQNPNHSLFREVNPYRKRLLINRNTKELIEEYDLQFLNQEDFNSYSRDIELRKEDNSRRKLELLSTEDVEPYRACPYIYKVKYFTNTSVDELCSTIYNGLLYVNKVDLRLKQINDIPLTDQLYLYQCCLEGFKVLYEKVGYFDIIEQMIFFTQEGKVKVWMNPNLSKHHPNYESGTNVNVNSIQIQGSQSQMLKNLINLIENNTDSMLNDRQVHFREYLKEKGLFDRLSFYKAIDQFHRYIEDNGLSINNHMKSIQDLFYHDEQHNNQDLYQSQSQKNSDNPIKVQKDYESLKNSNHQLSFQKGNSYNYDRLTPVKFNQLSHLDASRASKNSYKSDYNGRKIDTVNRVPRVKNRTIPNHNHDDSHSNIVQIAHPPPTPKQFYPTHPNNLTVFSKPITKVGPQREITFCPPERKVFQQQPLITKYRSLQKAPAFVGSQNRPITFSYQNQPPPARIIHTRQPLPALPATEAQIVHKQRKQSIIDKLNSPVVIQTVNTIKTQKSPSTSSHKISDLTATKKINYFSTTEAYMLDSEIAEDMMKYLGFNPNLI